MHLPLSKRTVPYNKPNHGFTLVELLIVIVIIGLLSGVVLSIINPGTIQRKTKEAVLIATINKVALAVSGYYAAHGYLPGDTDMLALINYATFKYSNTGTKATSFKVSGVETPKTCDSWTYWRKDGEEECYFTYYGEADNGHASNGNDLNSTNGNDLKEYYIFIKSFVYSDSLLVYSSKVNYFYRCYESLDHPNTYNIHTACTKY